MRLHTLFFILTGYGLLILLNVIVTSNFFEFLHIFRANMTWLLLSILGCAPKYPIKPNPQARNELHQLFENHIVAIGGRTQFQSKTNLLIKGRVRTMTSGSVGFETIKIAPNQIWTTISTTSGEKASRGWDGKNGWIGDRMLTETESKKLKRSSNFYFPLNHNVEYQHAYYVENTNFGGRPARVVLAQTSSEEWQELWSNHTG